MVVEPTEEHKRLAEITTAGTASTIKLLIKTCEESGLTPEKTLRCVKAQVAEFLMKDPWVYDAVKDAVGSNRLPLMEGIASINEDGDVINIKYVKQEGT